MELDDTWAIYTCLAAIWCAVGWHELDACVLLDIFWSRFCHKQQLKLLITINVLHHIHELNNKQNCNNTTTTTTTPISASFPEQPVKAGTRKANQPGLKWGKRLWGFGMQWHQLEHMKIICTSLQTDNQITPHHSILWARCSSWCRTNSVKAVKVLHQYKNKKKLFLKNDHL